MLRTHDISKRHGAGQPSRFSRLQRGSVLVAKGKEFPYKDRSAGNGANTVITSKLTSKAQTTIPAPVRTVLHLREGDELVYSIESGRVILTKADRGVIDEPFATFDEWASDGDREAYADL